MRNRTSRFRETALEGRKVASWKIAFLIATSYAGFLASLPAAEYKDRQNYLAYATYPGLILDRYLAQGWSATFSNEPLWLVLNIALSKMMPPQLVVSFIVFAGALVTALYAVRHCSAGVLCCVLALVFVPVIKNYIIHIRQGFAVALFLSGIWSPRLSLKLALLSSAAFVHSSFLFVAPLYAISRYRPVVTLRPMIRVGLYLVIGVILAVSFGYVASALGARQADDIAEGFAGGSGLGWLFWVGILSMMLLEGRGYHRENSFSIAMVISFLSGYFLLEGAARIFESGVLLVVLSCFRLSGVRLHVSLSMLAIYLASSWISRLSMPHFGWAYGF